MRASRALPYLALPLALACASAERPAPAPGPESRPLPPTVDLAHHFQGTEPVEATFVLLDDGSGGLTRYAPERAATRFRPASTFKIPNTIIVLETGVAEGADFTLPWDSAAMQGATFFPRSWRRSQTLETAFRNSVYWYYQELARRVGPARMAGWLEHFDYGNRSLGGGIDQFWLRGDLEISPDEQVRFLRRLRRGEFDVSRRSLEILEQISLLEAADGYRIHGKTGTSEVTDTRENGWIVGWVETGGETLYYALNMEGETVWEDWPPQDRVRLVSGILRDLGVIPR